MTHPGVHSMALGLCLCFLYGGYETARASSLSLFNSTDASGASTAGLSFVLSLASLQLYGRGTEVLGSRWTLVLSAGGCCAIFLGFALVSFEVDVPLEVVSMLFAVRETYVALIGTQVWGMLSSSLKERGPRESRRWFCIIQVCMHVRRSRSTDQTDTGVCSDTHLHVDCRDSACVVGSGPCASA